MKRIVRKVAPDGSFEDVEEEISAEEVADILRALQEIPDSTDEGSVPEIDTTALSSESGDE